MIEPSSAHQGRVASDGCHYCRKNCNNYNLTPNTRHGHSKATHCDPSKGAIDPLFISDGQLTVPVHATEQVIQYNRKDWPHWVDANGDCQDTRQEILIARSLVPATFKNNKNCFVDSGKWNDFYYNEILSRPSDIDIDHVVPLKEAFISGGSNWPTARKEEFANDPENLVITNKTYNRQKGSQTPLTWSPSNKEYACEYLKRWLYIKNKYQLNDNPKILKYFSELKCEN